MTGTECPIQVTCMGHWIDCTFPPGHKPPHSWAIPGAPVFVMAPRVGDLRNRDGGEVVTAEERQATLDAARRAAAYAGMALVDPRDLQAALRARGTLANGVYDRLSAAAGMA